MSDSNLALTQENLEHVYSKKASREYVLDLVLAEPDFLNIISEGIELIEEWANAPSLYAKKAERKESVLTMDLKEVVQKIVCDVLLIRSTATLCSFASSLGSTLNLEDNRESITLAAELLALLLPTQLFFIHPKVRNGQWHVYPNFTLTAEERLIAERGMFIPPSITKPKKLKNNRDSGYEYLRGESLILGGNLHHHDGDISLAVLNKQNSIPLTINEEFINSVEPERKNHIDDLISKWKREGKQTQTINESIYQEELNWETHLDQADFLHDLMIQADNKFYVTNKVDKRGRIYAQGHHINPMGSSYKKATLDLANKKQVVVPAGYFQ